MSPSPVVVVGAGLGGLAAACHLRAQGHDVVVLEATSAPGGRAGLAERGGYRFDTGPTVLTMPELIEGCLDAVGVAMSDVLTLRPVDPMYRACFPDGSEIRVRHGREAMEAEIAAQCGPRDAAAFGPFCDWLGELYAAEMANFIDRNFDSVLDLVRPLAPAFALARLGAFRHLGASVGRRFADERLRRLFTFQSMYAGLAPYEALAVYAVITYMDTVRGVVTPDGGMHAVPRALADAASAAGVTFHYDTRVQRILLRDGSAGPVTGVELADGERIATDVVVANPDLPVAYDTLLPGLRAPRAARRGRFSPSAVVWHAGGRVALPPGAAQHNIHFGREWDTSFRELIDDGTRMSDPSILVTVPTLADPSLAPPGRHVVYALEPVPNLDGRIDWSAERETVREELVERVAKAGYEVEVEVEDFVDPSEWQRRGMAKGTPFALAHRFFQSGPFRPGNIERRAPGLVFVGSGTVPGVGVPMVLVSGRLAAQRVAELRRRT